MRIHSQKWNIARRRMIVLFLLCGLLLPIIPRTDAATVTYEYNWIDSTTGLPTDNQWHDYFIAWEDTDDSSKVWFTERHWLTPDGENNYDVGGSHWMEYKAASTLPDNSATHFSSKDCLGHMQIKYAGKDDDNRSPMYFIRVSKMSGGYIYFTEYEPTDDEREAEAFTFQDKGNTFHIFVNISGKADRYLTRNGQYLETTESSSYGGGEYWRPLRVYQRTFTVDGTEEVPKDVIGKRNLYEYRWVNTNEELEALRESEEWTDMILAWEDCDGGDKEDNNPDKVWYTKEIWYDQKGNPNFENDSDNEFHYYSNDYLGSDGYGSAYAESFILPTKAGHFQTKYVGLDNGNTHDGIEGWGGAGVLCPKFQFRFDTGDGTYLYIGNNGIESEASKAESFSVQLRVNEEKKDQWDYHFGSVWILVNINNKQDEVLTRVDNSFDISNWIPTKDWEKPFRIYTVHPIEYDAVVKDFTIGKGATYSVNSQLLLAEGVTITVEDGGVLTVDNELLNNGKIIVKNGGTLIINEGAYVMAYDHNAGGSITLDGGNMLIMDGAKVICDLGDGKLEANNGATILNRGLLMVGGMLSMNNNSYLRNESGAMLLFGGKITQERGSINALSFQEIESRVETETFTKLVTNKSKIVNKGTISDPTTRTKIDTSVGPSTPGSGKPTPGGGTLNPGFGDGTSRFG